jgi:N-acetyl-1-D-myo-inositol-2-amino-2-deoxy-alpha-D-glucopyranoside deacetylase/mycothiol S-conjugate amidase
MTVHAHPEDEVVFTGGVLAQYHNRGVKTVLVTATNGEEGEIHDPDLVVPWRA